MNSLKVELDTQRTTQLQQFDNEKSELHLKIEQLTKEKESQVVMVTKKKL